MILVDSSVWIDYFRGRSTAEAERLDGLLDQREVAVGDLILTEVLRGFDREGDFQQARRLLTLPPMVEIGGRDVAIQAAENFRKLRRLGLTVRKTIDSMIATRCIVSGYRLLHSDRDFDPYERHLGLRVVKTTD